MNVPIPLEGFEGQTIEAQTSGLSGPKLLVNGQPAPAGSTRGTMLLQRNDGTQAIAQWKSRLIDVPQLVVDGKTVDIVPPLKWYQWVWSGLPILLMFGGGCLGGIAGVTAFGVNAQIFRSAASPVVKYVATGCVSLCAVIVYVILAGMLLGVLDAFGVRR